MKVTLNQTNFNIINPAVRKNNSSYVKYNVPSKTETTVLPNYAQVISNVSFGMNPHMEFLLNQSERLKCAYTGKIMLPPNEFKMICQKLLKRPNAQSAINLLQGYQQYMLDVEGIIFDILSEASHKNKRGFDAILKEEAPDALIRLKEKQKNILTGTNKIIDTMSESVAEQVRIIRDEALIKMENDTFGRKCPLDKLEKIQAKGKDAEKLFKIYKAWYGLPSSSEDIDAFIVKYSKRSHDDISKRLLSSSVATIDHIKSQASNGSDSLNNMSLVTAYINNKKDNLNLGKFIKLEEDDIDIKKNLQKHINDVISQVNNPRMPFSKKPSYPISVSQTILEETNGDIVLNTDSLRIPQNLARQDEMFTRRLEQKYTVKRRHG